MSAPAARRPGPADASSSRQFLIWLLAIAVLVGADLVSGALLGYRLDLTGPRGGGRVLLMLVAAALAFRAMAGANLPLAHFGLNLGGGWERRLAIAFGIGLGAGLLLNGVAVASGAILIGKTRSSAPYLFPPLTAIIGLVAAMQQEIVYRGYLQTLLRDRLGGTGAIALGALLFALTLHFDPAIWSQPETALRLACFGFLGGLLLGVARQRSGSIIVPYGLVAGWLFLEIFLRRAGYIAGVGDPVMAAWFAPTGDVRLGPVAWILLVIAVVIYGAGVRKQPADQLAASPAEKGRLFMPFLSLVNPFSNLAMLAPLDIWFKALWRARFNVHPIYWARLAFSLIASTISTVLNLPERVILPWLLRHRPVLDPVVVVGLHRSGTSFLQRLIALDPQFASPRTIHVINPTGFVVLGRLLTPLLGPLLPWRRPMDSMEYSLYAPDEDEFAIAYASGLSPYWSMVFPRLGAHYDRFIRSETMTPSERRAWQRAFLLFLRKFSLVAAGRPLLKSPYHAARVDLITDLFPGARFVHIHRDPVAVYSSTISLERRAFSLFQLQLPPRGANHSDRLVAGNYMAVAESFYTRSKDLPPSQIAEVRYEDLAANPVKVIEAVYANLGLEVTPAFRRRLVQYLDRIGNFTPNAHPPLPAPVRATVAGRLAPLMRRWGYSADK